MITRFRSILVGATLVVVLLALGSTALAHKHRVLPHRSYRGRTSQRQMITFRVVEGTSLRRLAYRIVDKCPKGKSLINHDYGFPTMPIVRERFGGTFFDHAHHGRAQIKGHVYGKVVKGSLVDRTENAKTHRLCRGTASFLLRPHR